MATLFVDTLEPQSGTALTIGEAGQNTVLAGNDLRANVLQDAGGNAIFTSDGSGNLTGVDSQFGSAMTLLTTTTLGSAAAEVDFSSTYITNTYSHYMWKFYMVRPATDGAEFEVNFSTDNLVTPTYGAKSSAFWYANHYEDGSGGGVQISSGFCLQGSTSGQTMAYDSDRGQATPYKNAAGELHLFNPSSTTYIKNWWSRLSVNPNTLGQRDQYSGGYVNTTTAINAVRFSMSSGDIKESSIFKLWGWK